MKIEIKITKESEAGILAEIQKAAFKPLYDKFHDAGNPHLRDEEDIISRLNENNRYFTIYCDGVIVGGVFYRCKGMRSPEKLLKEGEYYLARIYIDPKHQNKGIAREAIKICENEFTDIKAYYVDFPTEMEKNRRFYESVGFKDTGEFIINANAPKLSVYRKLAE